MPFLTASSSRALSLRSAVAYVLALALSVEIGAFAVSPSDAVRGAAVGVVVSVGLVLVFVGFGVRPNMSLSRTTLAMIVPWALVMVVGAYGIVRGVSNNWYFLAADAFHWFIELAAVSLLTWLAFHRQDPERVARFVGRVGVAVGLLSVGIVAAVAGGVETEGAHRVAQSWLVRLSLSRGFPELLYLPVVAAMLKWRHWSGKTRRILLVAFLLVSFSMIASFKRTLWLSCFGGFAILVASRGMMPWLVLLGSSAIGFITLLYRLFPTVVRQQVGAVAKFMTYSDTYTVGETLGERLLQYAGLLPQIAKNPMGYGFGAEFVTYAPRAGEDELVHYVHSFYLYYALQVGVAGVVLTVAALLALAFLFWRRLNDDQPEAWMTRVGIAVIAVLLVNGITMVSIHTVFAGFGIGLGMAGAGSWRPGLRAHG